MTAAVVLAMGNSTFGNTHFPPDHQQPLRTSGTVALFDSLLTTDETENLTAPVPTTNPNYLPPSLSEMSSTSRNCVIAYVFLFLLSITGNSSVFLSVLAQLRKSKSRICLLILHLSIADLIVTLFVMPIEIVWRLQGRLVRWERAVQNLFLFTSFRTLLELHGVDLHQCGSLLCNHSSAEDVWGKKERQDDVECSLGRLCNLFIASSTCFRIARVVIVGSVPRTPWGLQTILSLIVMETVFSFFQSIIFRVQSHPQYSNFVQCVSLNFFGSLEEEVAYNVSSLFIMYFIPLVVVIFTFGRILWKIHRKSKEQCESRK